VKGWKQVAKFVGEPVSVVERWLFRAMPVFKTGPIRNQHPRTKPERSKPDPPEVAKRTLRSIGNGSAPAKT